MWIRCGVAIFYAFRVHSFLHTHLLYFMDLHFGVDGSGGGDGDCGGGGAVVVLHALWYFLVVSCKIANTKTIMLFMFGNVRFIYNINTIAS